MQDTIDDLINSIYNSPDVSQFVNIILNRYHSLTLYVIEPYLSSKENNQPLVIPATDNYSIHDYGGHLIITPNDLYAVPLFACGEFLLAVEKALEILINLKAEEIAVLGDPRAKLFAWDSLEKLNLIKLINFSPPETFEPTRAAVIRFLKEQNTSPKKLRTLPQPE